MPRSNRTRVLTACLALAFAAACSKDTEVNAALDEIEGLSNELVRTVDAAADPGQGVDEALKLLEARGAATRAKLAALKDVRGYQVNEATKKRMGEVVTKAATQVMGLQMKHMGRMIRDSAFKAKLEKLGNDYNKLLTSM